MDSLDDVVRVYRQNYKDDEGKSEEYRGACRAVNALCDRLELIQQQIRKIANEGS